ncbi:hypothetical protein ACHWQZ_G019590 [Mnemiopsis leidyi]
MPRHGELSWQVAQLESKVEFMMENLFTKMDRIYEKSSQISCCSDKNYHETELLRQEISLLRIRLHEMANKPIQCSCNHGNSVKISPSLSDVTMALIDSKKGTQAASNTANLWKKLKKNYKTPTPQNLSVDVKSIVAKFDETHNWNIGETEVSRPSSVAASLIGTPAPVSSNPLNQVVSPIDPSTKVSSSTAPPKKKRLKAQFIFKKRQGGA